MSSTSTELVTKQGQYYIFPKKAESYKKHGIPLELDILDLELSNFMNSVVNEPERTIRTMIRTRGMSAGKNPETGKRKHGEFLVWYEEIHGYNKHGNVLKGVYDIPKGYDFEIAQSEIYKDLKGNEIPITKVNPVLDKIYTVPFSPETIQTLVGLSTLTDGYSIQFIVEGSRSFGGYDYPSFRDLSWEELEVRGQLGRANFPVDVLFSRMTGQQRLDIEKVQK
jgi:hypothetical protein